jgi:hypothetical protein
MEGLLQTVVPLQRVPAMLRVAEHIARLPGQSSHRTLRRDMPAAGRLFRNMAHRSPRDGGNRLQQVAGLGVAMQRLGDAADSPGEVRRRSHHRFGYVRKRFSRHRCDRPGYNRQKF